MSACIWYVSKYVAIPAAQMGGTRSFMLMREMARQGHRCVILTSDSNALTVTPKVAGRELVIDEDGVEMHWLRTLKYERANSLRRILSWLDFEWKLWRLPKHGLPRPDTIIVSSLSLLTIFNGLWLRSRYRCKLIFEVRDIWPLTIVEEGGFSPRNPLVVALVLVEKLAYHRSDAIVGTMPNLKQHVEETIGASPPVHCIPFGVDEALLTQRTPLPAGWVERYVPKGKCIVCHAGTIGITNALDTLFECARAMNNDTRVHFLIVGEGGMKAHYQALCADLPNVTFAPAVPKEMVQSVLEQCDILYFSVHPSKVWKYGLSLNKVIDYMLAAKPILASYTGYPTMVDQAGSGVSVPAGDASALEVEILRMAGMPEADRRKMGQTGRDWLLRNRRYRKLAEDYLRLIIPGQVANEDAGETHVRAG